MQRLYTFLFVFIICGFQLQAQNCQTNPPGGLKLSNFTSCSIKLTWKPGAPNAKFQVRYKPATATQWSNWIKTSTDTFYTFSSLKAGKKYDFNVQSKCTDGSQSAAVSKSGKTLVCTLPDVLNIVAASSTTVKITAQTSCPFAKFSVRYTTATGVSTIKTFQPASTYLITDLLPDSTYLFEVTTCKLDQNNWTAAQPIHLPKLPNIVFILIDDARSDYFSCCGAFPFFHTPNIDRIANEGVNFKRSYVVTSMCAPSRASIATGLFTLKTGVFENGTSLDTSKTTFPEILHNNGYYTALIGKNHNTFLQEGKDEFDYSLESHDENQGQINYLFNGVIKIIDKPNVETLTDSAIAIINRVDDPLLLWLAYRTPHYPNDPLAAYEGNMANAALPWKPDTAKYSVNYPSFLYDGNNEDLLHGKAMDSTYKRLLEVIEGLDSCVGILYDALESTGKLDNTLLIFMSDNGFTLGSHWLNGKSVAYEPSMKVPLLIRYPEWFAAGTSVSDQIVTNLDIAPTVYQLTGINYTEPLDGGSLKNIYDGTYNRSSFYYLMLNEGNGSPSKRAIRDLHYKYIHYTCFTDTVEEFFDMVNDSLELTNLVNNHNYDVLVQTYREKYDSIRLAFGDVSPGPIKPCYISHPYVLKEMLDASEEPQTTPLVYPTITRDNIEVYIPWKQADAILYNEFGKAVGKWKLEETYSKIDFPALAAGIYYLQLSNDKTSVTKKLIITAE
ncbi:MAG: sulfatase-like hydrolase/transferase [Chitinophagales bacterium]